MRQNNMLFRIPLSWKHFHANHAFEWFFVIAVHNFVGVQRSSWCALLVTNIAGETVPFKIPRTRGCILTVRARMACVTLTGKRDQIPSYIVLLSVLSVLLNRAPPNGFLDHGLQPQRDHIFGIDKFLQLYALSMCIFSCEAVQHLCWHWWQGYGSHRCALTCAFSDYLFPT